MPRTRTETAKSNIQGARTGCHTIGDCARVHWQASTIQRSSAAVPLVPVEGGKNHRVGGGSAATALRDLAQAAVEDLLAAADVARSHLQQFVVANPREGILQGQQAGGLQLDGLVGA